MNCDCKLGWLYFQELIYFDIYIIYWFSGIEQNLFIRMFNSTVVIWYKQLGLTHFQGFGYLVWMLLTFNNILATYYTSRPMHSLDNRYANIIREFLPPVALFYPCSAKNENVIDWLTYVTNSIVRPRGLICG